MLEEIWKDIPDYEGLYQVSNYGRVKSLHFGKEKLLKPQPNSNGYLRVYLYKEKKQKLKYVHQLVAIAFIPNNNPIEKTEINHIDENKENNCVNNLCWITHKENCNYGTKLHRQSEKMKGKFKGEQNPMYGKHHTEESKKKISNGRKGKYCGINNPFYGKHHTEESKKKLSLAHKH